MHGSSSSRAQHRVDCMSVAIPPMATQSISGFRVLSSPRKTRGGVTDTPWVPWWCVVVFLGETFLAYRSRIFLEKLHGSGACRPAPSAKTSWAQVGLARLAAAWVSRLLLAVNDTSSISTSTSTRSGAMSGAGQADLAGHYGSPLRRPARERSPRRTAEEWAMAQQHAISTPVGMTQEQQHITESVVTQIAAGVMSADEKISQLEVEARRVAPALVDMDTRIHGIGGTTQSLTDTMAQMEETMVNMLKQITGTQASLDSFKSHMTNSLAAAEGTLSSSLNGLTQKVQQNDAMIRQVESMMSNSAGMGQTPGSHTGSTSFLPLKI